jgi:hypothetical protein
VGIALVAVCPALAFAVTALLLALAGTLLTVFTLRVHAGPVAGLAVVLSITVATPALLVLVSSALRTLYPSLPRALPALYSA